MHTLPLGCIYFEIKQATKCFPYIHRLSTNQIDMAKLKIMKCPNCTAPINAELDTKFISCKSCGSNIYFEIDSATVEKHLEDTCNSGQYTENIQHKYIQNLLNQIEFLECEYKETMHPSIPKKIEIIKNKLKKFKNNNKF